MRETRTSGSEGGGAELNRLSLPLSSRVTDMYFFTIFMVKALLPSTAETAALGSQRLRNAVRSCCT